MPGVRGSFLELFMRNQAAIFAFLVARGIRGPDLDDVMQDAATVLWEKFDTFEPGTSFKAWAFAVARIEVLRFVSGRGRDPRTINLDEETLGEIESLEVRGPPEIVDYRKDILIDCMDRLSEKARGLLGMRYSDGLPFEAIAERLRATSTAIRVRLHRIRRRLHDCVRASLGGVVRTRPRPRPRGA